MILWCGGHEACRLVLAESEVLGYDEITVREVQLNQGEWRD